LIFRQPYRNHADLARLKGDDILALPAVRVQLENAGVRLAAVLSRTQSRRSYRAFGINILGNNVPDTTKRRGNLRFSFGDGTYPSFVQHRAMTLEYDLISQQPARIGNHFAPNLNFSSAAVLGR
jgi:hypothetical protein